MTAGQILWRDLAVDDGNAVVMRIVLPVSGVEVTLRQPTGREDLLLAGQHGGDPVLVRHLITRLAATAERQNWGGFCVTDIDTMILRLRQFMLGNELSSSLNCASAECGSRVTLSFGIDSYLKHHKPHKGRLRRQGWAVAPPETGAWYTLAGTSEAPVKFRLPVLDDQIAVAHEADAAAALARRCIQPALPPGRLRRRVEAAMTKYAPPLASPLHGRCPDCGTGITARFEARHYCLQELGQRSRFVYDDIDTLAERYHWSEQAILTMPGARRAQYADRARQARQS